MKQILLVVLLGLCLTVSAQINLYVSATSGNDTNSGTADDEAFLSLAAAVAASSSNVTNPDNEPVTIYISGGTYNGTNVGLTVTQNTQIVYWEEDGAPTVVVFQGDDSTKDTYFYVQNTFVLNGNNGDDEIVFSFNNLKAAINFNNGNATAVYTLSVLFTLFDQVSQGIYAVNVNQFLVQQSVFNSTYTADPINAQGPGLGSDSNFELDRVDFSGVPGVVNAWAYDQGTLLSVTWVGGTKGAFILQDGSWEVSSLNVTDATTAAITSGAAIDFTGGVIEITDSTFTNCQAHNGGALFFQNVDASLVSVTFTNCLAIASGGAYAHDGSYNGTSSMEDVTFQSNTAANYGGGIELYGAFNGLSLYNVAFNNNTAGITGSLIDCCGVDMTQNITCGPITVSITDDSVSSLGNIGGQNISTCVVQDVDDFSTAVSVSNDSVNSQPNDDDGGSLVWLWIILSLVVVAVIVAIVAGAGYFVYRKRKLSQYAAVD